MWFKGLAEVRTFACRRDNQMSLQDASIWSLSNRRRYDRFEGRGRHSLIPYLSNLIASLIDLGSLVQGD